MSNSRILSDPSTPGQSSRRQRSGTVPPRAAVRGRPRVAPARPRRDQTIDVAADCDRQCADQARKNAPDAPIVPVFLELLRPSLVLLPARRRGMAHSPVSPFAVPRIARMADYQGNPGSRRRRQADRPVDATTVRLARLSRRYVSPWGASGSSNLTFRVARLLPAREHQVDVSSRQPCRLSFQPWPNRGQANDGTRLTAKCLRLKQEKVKLFFVLLRILLLDVASLRQASVAIARCRA